jgi:hypothetical protein
VTGNTDQSYQNYFAQVNYSERFTSTIRISGKLAVRLIRMIESKQTDEAHPGRPHWRNR